MRSIILTICMTFVLLTMNLHCMAQDVGLVGGKEYGSPERFEKAIQRFEAMDKKQAPPQGALVGVGSSSMAIWSETIQNDLAPLTIIPRGFGGSNMNDALYYADRIVLPYKPRAILVYEGDNDVAQGISPKMIASTFSKFVEKVHKQLPTCRIYFLSIKPSIKRWRLWPMMKEANRLISRKCAEDKRLTFVDLASGMLNDEGKPRKNIFNKDNLHMKREGYVIWRDSLRPILMKSELRYEVQNPSSSSNARRQKSNMEPKEKDGSTP